MNPAIIVNISETGDVTVEAQGMKGTGCKALTSAMENALGVASADRNKPEYFQQQTVQNVRTVGQK